MVVSGLGPGCDLSEADLRRLRYLTALLENPDAQVRYLDYRQAEEAAETLAARLLEVIGEEDLHQRVYLPIPRGGLIVLGMLSYLLDLSPDQVVSTGVEQRQVVLVDDAALTGSRLRRAVEESDSGDLIVTHLASPKELRTAVEADDRVKACIAAVDLQALDAAEGASQATGFRELWRERLPDERYWYGHPELIAFPWSEPDQILWDPVAERIETGWHLVSPEMSLKSRGSLGPPSEDRSNRHFQFPDDIAFGEFDDGYLICQLETEEVFRLDTIAGKLWGALGTLGDVKAAEVHLARKLNADQTALAADIAALAGEFVDSGILERTYPVR